MNHPEQLLGVLPPYQGAKRLVTLRQDTFDIIREIMKKHRACVADYDKICVPFWKGTGKDTAENLYYFAKKHLPYKVEPTLQQTVKTPAAILEERHDFGNDCKHYALFIIGVGEALRRKGYPVKCFYRFASYNKKRSTPGHVFAVFVDNGQEYWADPVPEIGGFNRRYIVPFSKQDKMPPMSKNGGSIGSLYDISGLQDVSINHAVTGFGPDHLVVSGMGRVRRKKKRPHWLDKAFDSPLNPLHPGIPTPGMARRMMHGPDVPVNKSGRFPSAGPMVNKQDRFTNFTPPPAPPQSMPATVDDFTEYQDLGKIKLKLPKIKIKKPKIKLPKIKIQPGKLLKKVALAPSRNSFLLLVKLNTFNLAVKMWQKAAHDKNSKAWKQLADKWSKLGGKPDQLYKEIKRGVNTHNKLHKNKKVSGHSMADEMYMSGAFGQEYVIGYISGVEDMEMAGIDDDVIGGYDDSMSIGDILCFVHDNHNHRMRRHKIGVAHVAVAAGVIAAAAPIIKALSGLLKAFGINTKKAEDAEQADTESLAEKINSEGETQPDGSTELPDGTKVKVQKNDDGSQELAITKVPGTSDKEVQEQDGEAYSKIKTTQKTKTREMEDVDGDGDDEEVKTKTTTKTKVKDGDGDTFSNIWDGIMNFVTEHKTWFIVGGVVIASLIILPKIFHRPAPATRRRK